MTYKTFTSDAVGAGQFGLATQSELARAHGISQSTVSRAVQRLQVPGELGFAPAPKPRRPDGIVDPAQLAQAARMLRSGLSLYRVAQQLGVSQSTLWRYTQQGLLPASQCLPRRRAARTVLDAVAQHVDRPALGDLALQPCEELAPRRPVLVQGQRLRDLRLRGAQERGQLHAIHAEFAVVVAGTAAAPARAADRRRGNDGVFRGITGMAGQRRADQSLQPPFRGIGSHAASLRTAANSSGRDQRDTVDNGSTSL